MKRDFCAPTYLSKRATGTVTVTGGRLFCPVITWSCDLFPVPPSCNPFTNWKYSVTALSVGSRANEAQASARTAQESFLCVLYKYSENAVVWFLRTTVYCCIYVWRTSLLLSDGLYIEQNVISEY